MKKNCGVLVATSVAAFQIFSSSLSAAPVNLVNGNSSVTINPTSDTLMTGWTVDGLTQLAQQGFWWRVGSTGGESSISTLPVVNQTLSGSTLTVKYSNGQFSVETIYTLLGGSAGSGNSDIGEQIKIENLSGSALNFHFFQYTDFDLDGTALGDTVELGQNLQGLFNEALQIKGGVRYSDTVLSPGANHAEAGIFPSTLNQLNDANPTTLSGATGPVSGDATWAMQWDKTIGVGGSLIISIDKNLYYTVPIPEPTTYSLFTLGLVLLGIVRRHSRRS
jgi:hypothetical protein